MKKRMIALLVSAVFILSACGKTTPKETEPTQPSTSATIPVGGDITIVQKPLVSVSVPSNTQTTTAEDGSPVFHYVYPTLSLVLPDAEVADKIILHHLNRLDKLTADMEDILQQALTYYSKVPFLYSITYDPMRIDQNILSMYGTILTYSGGAHSHQNGFGANYDLTSGEVLTLGSILRHVDEKQNLEALVIRQLSEIADELYLSSDYADYVHTRFQRDEAFDEDWYFTDKGLCFFFSPYEIAPYSSGTIVAEIPYSQLTGIISDEFFPPEIHGSSGSLKEVSLENADLSEFTQICELILERDSDKMLFYTDAVVENVKISQFNPTTGFRNTVFATPRLTPGDAIMIEASTPVRNALTITYVSGDQTVTIQH